MRCVLASLFLAIPAFACSPLPGADSLWRKPALRFLIVGEMHGSAEAPAIFADLVCAALASKRPIVVGVERSTAEQGAIDAFLTGENHEAATRAFLSHKGWHTFDGRSSRAMLEMLESLRALRVEVVAFAAARPADTPVQVEQRMAAALMA